MRLAAAGVVVLAACVWGVLHVGWYTHHQIVDYDVYQLYGDDIVHHHWMPYRKFPLEYPPGALPAFALPAVGSLDYRRAFQIEMAACFAAAVVGVLLIGRRRAAILTALAPLALGSVVISRFDWWPTALTVLALAAVLRRRRTVAAILIGTAVAAKLWPVLVVPLIGVWLWRNAGSRIAARWLALVTAVTAAWFLPFAIISPSGLGHSFHAQLGRPLQVESLGAAVLIAVHHIAGTTLHMVGSFGSQNVSGPGSHALEIATTVAGLLALGATYAAYARSAPSVDELLRYSAAVVAVTIAFGKVFSPQFLIWLMPLVPLVRGNRGRIAVPLFFAVLVLTQLYFPINYWRLADLFAPTQSWEVLVRDLGVVALAGLLAWPGAGASEPLVDDADDRRSLVLGEPA